MKQPHFEQKRIYTGVITGMKYKIIVDAPSQDFMNAIFDAAAECIAELEMCVDDVIKEDKEGDTVR